jgi:hypothetical protein
VTSKDFYAGNLVTHKFVGYDYQEHPLPIRVFSDSEEDMVNNEILMQLITMYPPKTIYRPGMLANLTRAPDALRNGLRKLHGQLPRLWKVRYVISLWGYAVMLEAQTGSYTTDEGVILSDHLVDSIERNLPRHKWRNPLVYAHAMPHGMYPASTYYLPERSLSPITTVIDGRPHEQPTWEEITDEAKTHFLGYDLGNHQVGLGFDMAPDDYDSGEAIGVFRHEEPTVQTLHILGYEQELMVPLDAHLLR